MPKNSKVPVPIQERFIDTNQLAEFLGVHRQTVCKMHRDGRLPKPFTIGKTLKWLESDIREHYKITGTILPQ